MQRISCLLAVCWFFLMPMGITKAQWQSVGPYGSSYNTILEFDPLFSGRLYARGDGTLFRSDDSGILWKNITPPVAPMSWECGLVLSATIPGEIYAVSDHNIYRSSDRGDNWSLSYCDSLRTIAFLDEFNPNHLLSYVSRGSGFAGGFIETIAQSTDAGAHWQTTVDGIDTTMGPLHVWVNPNAPQIMFATQLITYGGDVVSGSNFFSSIDGGGRWDTLCANAPTEFYDVVFDPKDAAILYVRGWPDGWSKSTDEGRSWNQIGSEIPGGVPHQLFISLTNSSVIFAPTIIDTLGRCDIYRSQTGGTSWSLWASVSHSQGISSLAVEAQHPEYVYVASYPDGVLRTSDEGASWTNISDGLTETCVYSCTAVSEKIFYAGVSNTGLKKTTDGGLTWQTLIADRSTDPGYAIVSRKNPELVYTNVYLNGGGLSVSADAGTTWQTRPPSPFVFAVGPDDSTMYRGEFLGSDSHGYTVAGLAKSPDQGMTWGSLDLGLGDVNSIDEIIVDPSDGEMVYVLVWIRGTVNTNKLIKSTDGGSHWTVVADSVAYVCLNEQNPEYVYYTSTSLDKPGSYVSSNGGATFQKIAGGYLLKWLAADPTWTNVAYAVTDDGTVIVTSDTGRTWEISPRIDQQSGLKGIHAVSTIDGGTLLLAETWTNGVLSYKIEGPCSVETIAEPRRSSLWQNFPNPFNPATTICFQLSAISWISVKVYDVLGREVATLVDELHLPGTYSVRWDASDLPSGVYFCRMRAGSFVETKKLLLLK
jgi:photosystem II stability/assembly factor-like uncharacterized protein